MNIVNYIVYTFVLYLTYIIISTEYSIIEHIKKDTFINPRIGGNGIQVGDWKFVSIKNARCDVKDGLKCNKLYIQDPEGSKTLIREIETDS